MTRCLLLFAIIVAPLQLFSQTGIGTTSPDASAKLEVNSTNKGFLPPRMTSTQRAAIASPAAGLLVYQTDGTAGLYFYTGGAWVYVINGTSNVLAVANGGTGTSSGSITGTGALTFTAGGTNQNITLAPSGTGYAVINNNVGMGTTTPADRLDVRSAMSVNEIKFRGLDGGDDSDPYRLRKFKIGNSNELQLHINDDADERFAIYGNSCVNGGCGEYSPNLYHYFRSDGSAYHAGYVGIGTTSPAAPLHVASYATQYVNSYGYLNPSNTAGNYTANQNINYSIQADHRIRASEFNAISDIRIKKNIQLLNTKQQLSELNKLKVVNYSYIDQLAQGNKIKTGFIAQEVENVNNQFVHQSADYIPSVYAIAKTTFVRNKVVQLALDKPHGLQKGDQVKFFVEGKKEVIKVVDEVINPQTFNVNDWEEPIHNLFVFGKKVTDFRAIDFDQITSLSVAAIQELSKQVDSLKEENAQLKNKLEKDVEAKLATLEDKISRLAARLK